MLKDILSNKKAFAKIYILIFSILFIGLIVGLVMAATHTSTADLEPEWSVPGVTNDYNVTISNTGGDSIDEVRIMQNIEYTELVCEEKTDWDLIFVEDFPDPELGIIDMCWYYTDDDHAIPDGSSELFEFSAKSPTEDPEECFLPWKFETRDNADFWRFIYDTTNIDSEPPITTKTFIGPQKIDGDVEWIDGVTLVNLTAVDMSDDCGIGVKETKYVNILAEDFVEDHQLDCDPERPCREPGYCESLLDYADDIPIEWWNNYTDPFQKEGESCHVLFYYSEDELGNTEDIQVNCFFVDTTPPIGTKTIGEPKIPFPDDEFQEIGAGTAEWTDLEQYFDDYSARLYVLDGSSDMVAVEFDVDIALEDIGSLSFWQKIDNTFGLNVILGIDSDGDGVYESQDKL